MTLSSLLRFTEEVLSYVVVIFFWLDCVFFSVWADSPSTSSCTVVADSRTAVSWIDVRMLEVFWSSISGYFRSLLKCLSTCIASRVSSKMSLASRFYYNACSSWAESSEDSIYSAWSSTISCSICSCESRSSKGRLSSKDSTYLLYRLKLGLSFLLMSSCFGGLFERNCFLLLPGLKGGLSFFGGENISSA